MSRMCVHKRGVLWRWVCCALGLLGLVGCGSKSLLSEGHDGARRDVGTARKDSAPRDTRVIRDTATDPNKKDAKADVSPDVPSTMGCVGGEHGSLRAKFLGVEAVEFKYSIAYVESPGSHSCATLFFRAGVEPTLSTDYLDITISYIGVVDPVPGMTTAQVDVYRDGMWFTRYSEVPVDVSRADGLFAAGPGLSSASFDGTATKLELEGSLEEVVDCYDRFPICI